MAYQTLQFSLNAPERVKNYIERHWLSAWLQEVHWLLSNETGIGSETPRRPFTYATALLLLESVGGISKVFYDHPNNRSGERFMALLTNYYPWDLEPEGGADVSNGPHLLYKVFRNPYAHALGTPDKNIGGMGTMAMTFPEAELEAMERSIVRPVFAERTLDIYADGRPTLHIPGLYWGIRAMVYRLTDDTAMMAKVMPRLM